MQILAAHCSTIGVSVVATLLCNIYIYIYNCCKEISPRHSQGGGKMGATGSSLRGVRDAVRHTRDISKIAETYCDTLWARLCSATGVTAMV